jgi:hypothetical protein
MDIKTEDLKPVADNVEIMQAMNKLFIVVDLEKTVGLSSSGKMMGIASTGGFLSLVGVTSTRGKRIKMNMYIGE